MRGLHSTNWRSDPDWCVPQRNREILLILKELGLDQPVRVERAQT